MAALAATLLVVATLPAAAQALRKAEPAERLVVRAEYDRTEQLQAVAAEYGHLVVDPEAKVLMVETDAFGRRRLERLGLRVSVGSRSGWPARSRTVVRGF